ncbi:ComEC/Rec2 family competence protein [Paenibacillus sp. 1A_MP2]|uniref:ComEC/Rec2 family competence protein n=1 Tax=Paenibacillus sp. 1A_MP2 TaxID=3457495 RepID=UPI003FCDE77B
MCALLAISFVAGLWWAYQTPQPAGAGVVQFLDIGQGDSTLITTPGGKHILVDGGGTVQFGKSEQSWKTRRDPYEVGVKVVVPLLKKRGIHRLDAVIVTHADQDHAGDYRRCSNKFRWNDSCSMGQPAVQPILRNCWIQLSRRRFRYMPFAKGCPTRRMKRPDYILYIRIWRKRWIQEKDCPFRNIRIMTRLSLCWTWQAPTYCSQEIWMLQPSRICSI